MNATLKLALTIALLIFALLCGLTITFTIIQAVIIGHYWTAAGLWVGSCFLSHQVRVARRVIARL